MQELKHGWITEPLGTGAGARQVQGPLDQGLPLFEGTVIKEEHHQAYTVCLQVTEIDCMWEKKLQKARESPKKLLQVMSLESAGGEDYKFRNEKKSVGVELKINYPSSPL